MAKTFTFADPDGRQHSIEGPDDATPEQALKMLQDMLGGGGQVVPAQERREVGRGTFAPLVEYSDGKVELGVPGMLKAPYDAIKGFMQGGYDPGAPEDVKTQQVENALGVAALATPMAPGAGQALAQQTMRQAVTPDPMSVAAKTAAESGITLPKHVAREGLRGSIERGIAGGARSLPVIGEPIRKAEGKALEQAIGRATQLGDDLAPGASPYSVGSDIVHELRNWNKSVSKDAMNEAYTRFGQQLPQGAMSPLAETRKAAGALLKQDQIRATRVNNPAIGMIEEALSRPQGLTFEGLQGLRTAVGNMIDDTTLPGAGTMQPALKQIYASLSKDMEGFVSRHGGKQGMEAWGRLNAGAKQVAADREIIQKLAGNDMRSPEGIVDDLIRKAGTTSSANQGQLLRLLPKLSGETRNGLAAVTIQRLGRTSDDTFGLAQFVTKYSALSPNGKAMLFPAETRKALDSLASTGALLKRAKSIDNSSGTARSAIVGAGLLGTAWSPTAVMAALPDVIATVAPALGAMWWMSRPATIREVSRLGIATAKGLQTQQGQALFRLALVNLAKEIAEDTGEDERAVAARLKQAMGLPDA